MPAASRSVVFAAISTLFSTPHVLHFTAPPISDDLLVLRCYCGPAAREKSVMIQGDAALIEDGSRFKKVRRLLYEKYPQYPEEAALGDGDVIVELTPRHVFSWGLE